MAKIEASANMSSGTDFISGKMEYTDFYLLLLVKLWTLHIEQTYEDSERRKKKCTQARNLRIQGIIWARISSTFLFNQIYSRLEADETSMWKCHHVQRRKKKEKKKERKSPLNPRSRVY